MDSAFMVGILEVSNFTSWWKCHLPAWMIVWCTSGECSLTLDNRNHNFAKGMMGVIGPDMFPEILDASENFETGYVLIGRDIMEGACFDLPSALVNAIYTKPIIKTDDNTLTVWNDLFRSVYDDTSNPARLVVLKDITHAYFLTYYNIWKQQNGEIYSERNQKPVEIICEKFYNMVYDKFRERRDVAYYADKLCITPGYLATILKSVCGETPKEVVTRQVILEMMYLLRNTGMTASQIAHTLHFPDASYMCRFFRRETGLSISEYRGKDATDNMVLLH